MTWAGTRGRRGTTTPRRAGRLSRPLRRAAALTAGTVLTTTLLAVAGTPARATSQSWYTYQAGTTTTAVCDARACVHRATSGRDAATEAWARTTLVRLARAWDVLVDQRGFRAPAPSPAADGDTRFHVYLADTGRHGYYGMTVVGEGVPGQPRRARSHLVLDNDMAGFSGSAQANLAATVAHEFFHAVQLNHDAGEDQWFMEASATWAETQVFPNWAVNRSYVREGQVGQRRVPLDHGEAAYGNFLLLERLTAVAGRDAVRKVWARLESGPGHEFSLQAVAAVLAGAGITWDRFYTDFAVANAFPHQHYPSRARSTTGRTDLAVRLGRGQRKVVAATRMQHLTARTTTVRLAPGSKRRKVAVSVSSSNPSRTGAVLVVVRKDGTLRKVPMRFSSSGTARTTVSLPRSRTSRLVLVTTNTSRAYRDCGQHSGWACGGSPVHDRTRVEVRARNL